MAPSLFFKVSNTFDLFRTPLRASRPALHFSSHESFLVTRQKCRGPASVVISIVSITCAFLHNPPLTTNWVSKMTFCIGYPLDTLRFCEQ